MTNDSMFQLFQHDLKESWNRLEEAIDSRESEQFSAASKLCKQLAGGAKLLRFSSIVHLLHALRKFFAESSESEEAARQALALLDPLQDCQEEFIAQWEEETHEERAKVEAALLAADDEQKLAEEEKVEKTKQPVGASPDKTAVDHSMLPLFQQELEENLAHLTKGLLALEQGEEPEKLFEQLMRAAHSIKGAGRVVGLEAVVLLSHSMEDAFVEAGKGTLDLNRGAIDLMLSCVDYLSIYQHLQADEIDQADDVEREQLQKALELFLKSGEAPKVRKQQKISAKEQIETAVGDRVLRVTAENLNRLMGLAGESMVESRWLQPFSESLMALKQKHNDLSDRLDALRDSLRAFELNKEVMHYLAELRQVSNECRQNISERVIELEMFMRRHASLSDRLYREVVASRMRPFSDGATGFERMIRDLSHTLGKEIHFEIVGKNTSVDRDILDKLEAPLNHLLRNCIDHGIEMPADRIAAGKKAMGSLTLEARHRAGVLVVTVRDDGRGIDIQRLRHFVVEKKLTSAAMAQEMGEAELLEFLFLPGFTTTDEVTEISGRGVGLDVVQSMVQDVGGVIRVETKEGEGTSFHLQLPITLSVIRALIVEIAGEPYAFPLARVARVLNVESEEIQIIEDRQYIQFDETNIGLIPAHQVLDLPEQQEEQKSFNVIVLGDRVSSYGLVVDALLGERELVVQELDSSLGKIPDIASGALMENGAPVLIIDCEDIVRSTDSLLQGGRLHKVGRNASEEGESRIQRILVVDDSITVREVECRLLRSRGYKVETAVDGADGWNALRSATYDLLVTDVDMPRMNGIELVKKVRASEELKELPVLIVSYKEREEDRLKGLEAGANYYLTKSSFHDESLLEAVEDLIGPPQAVSS